MYISCTFVLLISCTQKVRVLSCRFLSCSCLDFRYMNSCLCLSFMYTSRKYKTRKVHDTTQIARSIRHNDGWQTHYSKGWELAVASPPFVVKKGVSLQTRSKSILTNPYIINSMWWLDIIYRFQLRNGDPLTSSHIPNIITS